MHGVDAQIAGAHPPYDGIEIRAVTIHKSTCFMNGIGDILHVAFEEATGVGIGDHHCRNVRTQPRSEEHTSELQSLMRISYAVFCLKKKNRKTEYNNITDVYIQSRQLQ